MSRFLYVAGLSAFIFGAAAILTVGISSLAESTMWVPLVAYVGPVCYLVSTIILSRPRQAAAGHGRPGPWWVTIGLSLVATVVVSFLVFVLAVNVHLSLGGAL